MRFSLDFLPLDRLLQPLEPGNLVMLKGAGASAIAELLAFRAQLPLERGGLDSAAFFIDAGNCSDPYLLASLAKRYSLDSKKALRRVTNCRVFTMYQLTGLLSDSGTLADMADSYGSRLIILANLLGTFDEPETSQSEIDRLLNVIHTGLTEVKKKLTIITTLGPPNKYDRLVDGWPDTLVNLSPCGKEGKDHLQAELQKHPTRKTPDASVFTMNQLLFHPDSTLEELVR
jgi:hypothetical protein